MKFFIKNSFKNRENEQRNLNIRINIVFKKNLTMDFIKLFIKISVVFKNIYLKPKTNLGFMKKNI